MKTLNSIALAALTAVVSPLTSQAGYFLQTLGVFPDYSYPDIHQINESSVVVGTLGGWGIVGARWKATSPDIITSVGPAHSAWAYGINNAGTVVGSLDKDGGHLHPMMNVPGMGSAIMAHTAPAGVTTELRVVNDGGYAVGTFSSSAFYTHPMGFKGTLPTAKVGTNFKPVAINNDNDVLGKGSLGHIVYNLTDGTAVNVANRVPTVVTAAAMNELGDVAGVKSGNTAFIMPKPNASPVIEVGVGKVKAVHGMNDARELLITTHDNRPAVIQTNGTITYLDTVVTAPWEITKLADINNAGAVCGVMRRPSTPADNTNASYIVRGFRLVEFFVFVPLFN